MTDKAIEEALDGLAQFIIMNDTGTDESASAIEWHNTIKQALTRAKKEHELLELYRLKDDLIEEYQVNDSLLERQQTLGAIQGVREEIEALEEELK